MNPNTALRLLTDTMQNLSLGYMFVGSYSSNFYGIPRSTKDADLVVEISAEEFDLLIKSLPKGLNLDQQTSFEMVTSTKRDIIKVENSPFIIELFHLSDDDHDQTRFANRQQVEILPDWQVYLPKAEDVIIQKLRWANSAKRSKDFDDVVDILSVMSEKLDQSYLNHWTEIHGTSKLLQQAKEILT